MRNEFIAVYELDDSRPEPRYIAYCPEIPGATAEGETMDEARANLTEAIRQSLQQRREKTMREILFDLSPRRRPRNNRRPGNRGSAPRPANPVLNPAAAKSRRQEENMTTLAQKELPETLTPTFKYQKPEAVVCNEFTAFVERTEKWYIAFCLEIPGANGQGKTREDALENLAEAILLLLEIRREDGLRGVPPEAAREIIVIQ